MKPAEPEPDFDPPCTRCGAPDATPVGDEILCDSCYQEAGSCCGGSDQEPTE